MKKLALISAFIVFTVFSRAQVKDLNYFLDQGFKNNPGLIDYRNQVLINHADSELLVARQKPYIEGIGQFMYAPVLAV